MTSGKRPADDAPSSDAFKQHHKRSRTGIRAVLPTSDDAWRRKLERTKEANVRLAKTRQVFAKVKARALAEGGAATTHSDGIHPDRQARIDDEDGDDSRDDNDNEGRRPARQTNRQRAQPVPFQKAREEAEQRKAEAEAWRAEHERRTAERETKRVDRARQQKAMTRARRVDGGDQRRKLGRESGVLLDKVRRMMGK